jgi:two-component system, response regulator
LFLADRIKGMTRGSNKSVLLIADNPDEEALTLRAFRQVSMPFEVFTVHDGPEAIEFIEGRGRYAHRGRGPGPRVVLLDLNSPHVEGHRILRELRAHPSARLLPIVVLMSSFEQQDLFNGLCGGANSYVLKPLDAGQFAEAIRQLAHYWLEINEALDVSG